MLPCWLALTLFMRPAAAALFHSDFNPLYFIVFVRVGQPESGLDGFQAAFGA
nr:hypothetical protein [uncultured Kingella sp.]